MRPVLSRPKNRPRFGNHPSPKLPCRTKSVEGQTQAAVSPRSRHSCGFALTPSALPLAVARRAMTAKRSIWRTILAITALAFTEAFILSGRIPGPCSALVVRRGGAQRMLRGLHKCPELIGSNARRKRQPHIQLAGLRGSAAPPGDEEGAQRKLPGEIGAKVGRGAEIVVAGAGLFMFAWVFGPFPGSAYMGLPSQQALSDWVFQTFPLFPAITPESLTPPLRRDERLRLMPAQRRAASAQALKLRESLGFAAGI